MSGELQLMQDADDQQPALIATNLTDPRGCWNPHGTLLAVSGSEHEERSCKTSADSLANVSTTAGQPMVKCYSASGQLLRTLKFPGQGTISGLAWGEGGLRLAATVDSTVYFAHFRFSSKTSNKWTRFGGGPGDGTFVYGYRKGNSYIVTFRDVASNAVIFEKEVDHLVDVVSGPACCCIVSRIGSDQHTLRMSLYTPKGKMVTSRTIEMHEAPNIAMSATHIILATKSKVYVWDLSLGAAVMERTHDGGMRLRSTLAHDGDERWLFDHHGESTGGSKTSSTGDARVRNWRKSAGTVFKRGARRSADPVHCIALQNNVLVLARISGAVDFHVLGAAGSEGLGQDAEEDEEVEYESFDLRCSPKRIELNCDATRIAVIDPEGMLTVFDTKQVARDFETGEVEIGGRVPGFERSNVWDMRWAEDDPEYLAVMENRSRYIFKGTNPEPPIESTSWLTRFSDLEVETIDLDALYSHPIHVPLHCISTAEIKPLVDTRSLIKTGGGDKGWQDTAVFVQDNAHPRLWQLLADSALAALELKVAAEAYQEIANNEGEHRESAQEVLVLIHHLEAVQDKDELRIKVDNYLIGCDIMSRGLELTESKKKGSSKSLLISLLENGSGDDNDDGSGSGGGGAARVGGREAGKQPPETGKGTGSGAAAVYNGAGVQRQPGRYPTLLKTGSSAQDETQCDLEKLYHAHGVLRLSRVIMKPFPN
jgi:WD repeat-containing protein 35